MSTRELSKFFGRSIVCCDARTGYVYEAEILDAKTVYGNLRLSVAVGVWFELTPAQLRTLGVD